jgi:hypothetical protein
LRRRREGGSSGGFIRVVLSIAGVSWRELPLAIYRAMTKASPEFTSRSPGTDPGASALPA